MVEAPYVPDRGHIVWLAFSPQAGHEQARHRPALVLSRRSYNEKSSLALFCPITSRIKGYPFEVLLPAEGAVSGAVLSDQIRSLDWRARRARLKTQAPPQVVNEVREKLAVILMQDVRERATADTEGMVELLSAVNSFVDRFELVFNFDWTTTQANLEDPRHFIDDGGTFVQPLVDDESSNWGNRGSLLAAYRELRSCMEKCGVRQSTF